MWTRSYHQKIDTLSGLELEAARPLCQNYCNIFLSTNKHYSDSIGLTIVYGGQHCMIEKLLPASSIGIALLVDHIQYQDHHLRSQLQLLRSSYAFLF